MIKAHVRCRACGKTRELAGDDTTAPPTSTHSKSYSAGCVFGFRGTCRKRRTDLSSRLALDDPSLRRALPFPGIVPERGGGIAFRPCHNNRISLTG